VDPAVRKTSRCRPSGPVRGSATTIDQTGSGAVRGGSVDGEVKTFSLEDVSDDESEAADRDV